MNIGQEIQDLPRALRENLENNRREYEALIRQTRWGDGPIFLLSNELSLAAGSAARYAFEDLTGWPGILRHPADFVAYSLAVLRPGAIVMPIDLGGDNEAFLEAAVAARKRGTRILVVTNHPASPLAQMADGVFTVRAPGGDPAEERAVEDAICAHVAVNYLAWLAAKVLKQPRSQIDALGNEFIALPQHAEWMLRQLRDAARSFGSAATRSGKLYVAGGGHYHAVAAEWARFINRSKGTEVRCLNAWEFQTAVRRSAQSTVVCISGSRCRIKRQIHELARKTRIEGAKILSVTDGNDRELAERSELAVLLPVLAEPTGSVLALAFVEWAGSQAERQDVEPARTLEGRRRIRDSV